MKRRSDRSCGRAQGKKQIPSGAAARQADVFIARFGVLAVAVVCLWVATQVFAFTVLPPAYKGLMVTEPCYGLHSWNSAYRAWAARSHVKYGLAYTKGYCTLVTGDPPPEHPQRYVSHPQLDIYLLAVGMLLLGTEDWSVRRVFCGASGSYLKLAIILWGIGTIRDTIRNSGWRPLD